MADIELVIKIPEEEYRWVMKSDITVFANVASKECMLHAIKNGTPLPKGHGRLIDEREVYKKFYCRCLAGAAKDVLDETPTIIEADKAESER